MYICVPFPLTQTASSTNNKSDESVVIEKVSILFLCVFNICDNNGYRERCAWLPFPLVQIASLSIDESADNGITDKVCYITICVCLMMTLVL